MNLADLLNYMHSTDKLIHYAVRQKTHQQRLILRLQVLWLNYCLLLGELNSDNSVNDKFQIFHVIYF